MGVGLQLASELVVDAAQGTLAGPDAMVLAFSPERKRLAASRMRRGRPDYVSVPALFALASMLMKRL